MQSTIFQPLVRYWWAAADVASVFIRLANISSESPQIFRLRRQNPREFIEADETEQQWNTYIEKLGPRIMQFC